MEAPQPVQRLQLLQAELPPARSGGRMLPDVPSLVAALRKEARVL
jgi:hypothetical protein